LFVDYFGIAEFDLQYVEFALNQTEVAVGRVYCFMQSTWYERVASVVSLFNRLG
jgi:hypothetical protein